MTFGHRLLETGLFDDDALAQLRREFEDLVGRYNAAADSVEVDAEYLLVVARRRG